MLPIILSFFTKDKWKPCFDEKHFRNEKSNGIFRLTASKKKKAAILLASFTPLSWNLFSSWEQAWSFFFFSSPQRHENSKSKDYWDKGLLIEQMFIDF